MIQYDTIDEDDLDDYEPHPTERVEVKAGVWADIDVEMVPFVKWLNSVPSITTHYCCQGEDDAGNTGRPYILFTCSNLADLERVMRFVSSEAEGEMSVNAGVVRYTLRFWSRDRFKQALAKLADLQYDLEQARLSAPFHCTRPKSA